MLKVLTYNIHKGKDPTGIKTSIEKIKEAIHSVDPDLVFLQEVQVLQGMPAQFEYLADTLWPHTAYGKNSIYEEGHHGNAILSRYPISYYENISISTNPLEKRGLLHAVIRLPSHFPKRRIHAFCLHLDLFEKGRKLQVTQITKRIQTGVPKMEPLIVAGDFNDWRQRVDLGLSETFQELHGKNASTFPAFFPFLKLDRLYFRNLKGLSIETLRGKPWNTLSDHLPLLAEFDFSSPKE